MEVLIQICRYYHPSNARFWFYGDDDPEERLRILDGYLSEFEAREVDSTVGAQPLFSVRPPTVSAADLANTLSSFPFIKAILKVLKVLPLLKCDQHSRAIHFKKTALSWKGTIEEGNC